MIFTAPGEAGAPPVGARQTSTIHSANHKGRHGTAAGARFALQDVNLALVIQSDL